VEHAIGRAWRRSVVKGEGDLARAGRPARDNRAPQLARRRDRRVRQPRERGGKRWGRYGNRRADHLETILTAPVRQDGSIAGMTLRVGIVVAGLVRPVVDSRNLDELIWLSEPCVAFIVMNFSNCGRPAY